MRKILAILSSILTLLALKGGYNILTSTEQDVVAQRPILIVIALSLILPLLLLSLWLWRPKNNHPQND